MRISIALPMLSFSILGGCVTTNSLMRHQPTMTLTSAQSPDQLEECISTAFSTFDGVSTIRGEGHRTITVGHQGATAFAIQIDYGSPNTIVVRDAYGLPDKYRERIKRCGANGHWKGAGQ